MVKILETELTICQDGNLHRFCPAFGYRKARVKDIILNAQMDITLHTPTKLFLFPETPPLESFRLWWASRKPRTMNDVTTQKLWIPTSRGNFESVYLENILFVEAQDHYVLVTIDEERQYRIKSSLSAFYEKNLKACEIFRKISRSYVVNVQRIDKVENNYFIMEGNFKVPIPRDRKDEVLREVGVRVE